MMMVCVHAQIKGVIVDEDGLPIPYASAMYKETMWQQLVI